jgi:PAS domain S-box-containing protein
MQETNASKEQLLEEISSLRNRVSDLEKDNELAQLIIEKTSDNISIITFDLNAKYIYVSPSVKKILGYEPEDLLGKSFFDFIHPNDKTIIFTLLKRYISKVFKQILRIDDANIVETIEFRFKNTEGKWRNMQSTVNFIGNNLLAITRDTTSIKKSEIRNKRLGRIFEDSLNEIYLFDSETYKFTEVNAVAQKNMGYSLESLKEMTPLDVNPNYTLEIFEQKISPLRNGLKKKLVFEAIHKRNDNSFYNVEVHLQLLKIEDDVLFVAIILDVTDRILAEKKRKIADETLQLSNARLDALIESPRDLLMFSLDKNYKYTGYNKNHKREMEKLYDADIMLGTNMLSLIDNNQIKNEIEKAFERVLAGESFEEVKEQSDLGVVYQFNWSPIIKANSEIIGVSCLKVNITNRKKAENELKAIEDKFRILNELAPVGIYLTDENGNCTYANKLWLEMTGMELKEAINNGWVNALHPNDKEMIQKLWYTSKKSRSSWNLEYRYENANGKVVWVQGLADPYFDSNNKLLGYIGVNLDITERKKNERIIRENEAKFKHLFESELIGIMFWNFDGDIVDANNTFIEMVGYSREDLLNNRLRWRDMTPPEFVQKDKKMYQELSENGFLSSPYEKEYFHKEGHRVHIMVGAATLGNSKTKGVSFVLNIDDRKKVEKELESYREHLEDIVQERTLELESKNQKLDSAMKVFVGRELKIKDLQNRINEIEMN